MAIVKRKGYWFIYFRPFRNKKIGIKLSILQANPRLVRLRH